MCVLQGIRARDNSRISMSCYGFPDSKVHRTNMGPTWVLSAPDGPHVGPMNFTDIFPVYVTGTNAILRMSP